MAKVDSDKKNPPARGLGLQLSNEDLHSMLLWAAFAALLVGALEIGSTVYVLLQGQQQGFSWADGLDVATILPGLLLMCIFVALGEQLDNKELQVSPVVLYLSSWSLLAAGLAMNGWFPPWASVVLGILAVFLLVGGYVCIGSVYPTVGIGLKVLKSLIVFGCLLFWWNSERNPDIVMPILIRVYFAIAIVTWVVGICWFAVTLIRARSPLGVFSVILGGVLLLVLLYNTVVVLWAIISEVQTPVNEATTDNVIFNRTHPFLWGNLGLIPLSSLSTMLLFLSVRNSPLVKSDNVQPQEDIPQSQEDIPQSESPLRSEQPE